MEKNAPYLKYLNDQQNEGLNKCLENLQKWESFKNDYGVLRNKVSSLPSKICHEVMVPFSSKAFMPGKLVHTNEVLVLLGDNWFAQCSTSQAISIIDRRLGQCEKMIEKLNEEKRLFESWIKVTKDIRDENAVEIVEEYDEEKEKIWRQKHKEYLKNRKSESKEDKESDLLLMKHLDELELNEMKFNEWDDESATSQISYTTKGSAIMDSSALSSETTATSSETTDSNIISYPGSSTTCFSNTPNFSVLKTMSENKCRIEISESDTDSDDSGNFAEGGGSESEESLLLENTDKIVTKKRVKWRDECNTKLSNTQIIYVSHTSDNSDIDDQLNIDVPELLTPATISKYFIKPGKSILKTSSSEDCSESDTLPSISKFFNQTAVQETVIERNVIPSVLKRVNVSSVDVEITSKPTRPLSKFKANRANKPS